MSNLRKWPWQGRAVLLILVVAVCSVSLFAVAELGLRFRHRMKYGDMWGVEETYTTDNATGLRIPIAGGSFGRININSLGFRGPEIDVPKPASRIRIAFLGASTTYCAEVSGDEMTWPHLVTEAMRTQWPDAEFDYLNAGVPGYSVSNSLRNLRARVAPLQPDIIVVYAGHNDLSGNSYRLARNQGVVSERTEESLSWLSGYSLFSYLVEKNLLILSQQWVGTRLDEQLDVGRAELDALATPFREDLTELVAESQRVASVVALATFSTQLREYQSPRQKVRAGVTSRYYMPYMTVDALLEAYEAYNSVVVQVADQRNTLLILGEDSIPGNEQHFVDSVHFTDLGSRVMAHRVTGVLSKSRTVGELVAIKNDLSGSLDSAPQPVAKFD